jgi:DHA1 family multidrug/chloramphenicol efflux transport protein-like MFS transporter
MGLCFIGVIGYATIQELFAEMDAVRFIAIMANAGILAPLLGPLLGAIVIHYTSWRYIFIVIALCALVALWGLWRYMPEPIGQIKTDGELIPRSTLSLRSTFNNYKALCTNPAFCFSTLATGMLSIPCMAWIALAPVIMISNAKLTVIQYGLWQLPVFGATILGNWFLHRLSYKYSLHALIYLGSLIMCIGLALMSIMPYFYGENYLNLIPGIILYFFALSILSAPLNRLCLYTTPVSKGTASALISLTVMILGAVGIEIASYFYSQHSNLNFGLTCTGSGLVFVLCIGLIRLFSKKH